jgi:hypothetical protein
LIFGKTKIAVALELSSLAMAFCVMSALSAARELRSNAARVSACALEAKIAVIERIRMVKALLSERVSMMK